MELNENTSFKTLLFIAENLRSFPEAMTKSQLPEMKRKKEAAVEAIVKLFEENYGTHITSKNLLKKINNMKARLKKKMETECKPIKLNGWEKILYELINVDIKPAIAGIPGMSFGMNFSIEDETSEQSQKRKLSESLTPTDESSDAEKPTAAPKKRFLGTKKQPRNKHETKETKGLTTNELQRLVLIEQLHTARAQKDAALAQEAFYKSKFEKKSREKSVVIHKLLTAYEEV